MSTENELNTLEVTGDVPPVEPEDVSTPAEDAPAEDAPAEEKAEVIDETPDPAALKADIEKLKEERRIAQEKAVYWRQQKAASRADYFKDREDREPAPAATAPSAPAAPAATIPAPREEDFENYNDFIDAKVKHGVTVAKAEWDREMEAKANSRQSQEREAAFQAKLQRGFEKWPDFEDIALAQTVPITPLIKDIMADSDIPEDIAYYLGKNRSEAVRISHLTPLAATREIARIESQLQDSTPSAGNKPKRVTSATNPIKPIGSGGTVEKDPENMTQAEYNAWRLKRGAKPF